MFRKHSRRRLSFLLVLGFVSFATGVGNVTAAEPPVFSGPQVGESLPPMQAKGVFGELKGKTFDPVEMADGKPLLLIFLHQKTRPAFGLITAIAGFAKTRRDQGMRTALIYLDDDQPEALRWMGQIERLLPEKVAYGVSVDGGEGPGAYGLNRNVQTTFLVANEGKVTANFAIVSPQLQVDGPEILKAIVEVSGGGEVPKIESLTPEAMMRRRPARN